MKSTAKTCTDLMKSWGSDNGQWRPEPIKHALWRRNRGKTLLERAVASLFIACTRPRPSHWSAFAINESGGVWGAKDLQREQGWKSIKVAEKALHQAEQNGFMRREMSSQSRKKDTRLFFSAAVETKRVNLDSQDDLGTCTGSQVSDLEVFYSKGERKQLEAFDPDRRERAIALARAGAKYSRTAFADGVSLLRWAISQQEYNAKLGVGFLMGPNDKPKPKSSLVAELRLEPVQVPSSSEPVQVPKTAPVQVPSSLYVDKGLDVKLASQPQAAPEPKPQTTKPRAEGDAWEPPVELEAHMSAISRDLRPSLGKPNAATLKNFWRAAMQRRPGANLQEVAEAIARTVRNNEGLETWGGIFNEIRGTQASTQPPPPAKAAPPAKRPPPPVDPKGQEFAAGLVDMLAHGKTRGAS